MSKGKIPKALRNAVWNHNIGNNKEGKCYVGCGEKISINNFVCGHIISEKNGGKIILKNLKPICVSCNSSMGTMDMNDFINKYGFREINEHKNDIKYENKDNIINKINSNSIQSVKSIKECKNDYKNDYKNDIKYENKDNIMDETNNNSIQSIKSIKECENDFDFKSFPCDLCNKIFTRQYNLDRHINSVHMTGSKTNKKFKIYYCKCCNKKFTRIDAKNRHQKSCIKRERKFNIIHDNKNIILHIS